MMKLPACGMRVMDVYGPAARYWNCAITTTLLAIAETAPASPWPMRQAEWGEFQPGKATRPPPYFPAVALAAMQVPTCPDVPAIPLPALGAPALTLNRRAWL